MNGLTFSEASSRPIFGLATPGIKEDERLVGIRTAHMKEDSDEWRYFAELNTL